LGPIPFNGIILAHSNEAEWLVFKANRNNEAFLDRICVVTVPYVLRVTEETEIYRKLLRSSELQPAPCSPETLELLAKFCVMTRLKEHENSNRISKMRVYDGEKLKDTDPKAKTLQEYRDAAGIDEGMTGISTRFAYKTLSETFNLRTSRKSPPIRCISCTWSSSPSGASSSLMNWRENTSNSSRRTWRRDTRNSSARKSRKAYLESYG